MNTNHLAANVAPYIAYYGMTRDPFESITENGLFYSEPSRKQRLNILLHLTQYSNELMLIIGPDGSGKSTLLQQFRHKALDTWSVASIEVHSGIDERKLLQQLYHQLGMEFHSATHNELLEQMQHHFNALQRSARQAIMLIDDADQLPLTALRQILEMAALSNADHKPLLRVILLGTAELENKLNDPLLGFHADLPRRNLDLPPFDQEHTAHYVLHRLTAAHFVSSEPFTDSALHKLYKQSAGWPGHINKLAHNLLMDSLPATPQKNLPDPLNISGTFHPVRTLAALFTIVIIGALLIFQDDINTWLKPQIETLDTQTAAPEQPAKAVPPLTTAAKPTQILPVAQTDTTPPDTASLASKPIETTASSTASIAAEPEPVDDDTAPTEPPLSLARSTHPENTASPIQPTTVSNTPPATVARPNLATTPADTHDLPERQDNWLLKQNPTHYTLQLIAGARLDTLRKFIRQHRLTDNLALYHTTRKGQPWFGLTYGNYPDKQQATKARAHLPRSLRHSQPWVRNLAGIHDNIRNSRL